MKNLLILGILLAASYYGYNKFFASTQAYDINRFSLENVQEQPIPKNVLFKLWEQRALEACSGAKEKHNLTPELCRQKIQERHPTCERTASRDAPELVTDRATSKRLGRNYLECVTPHFFCNGTEVRTEEEAKKFCQ